MNPISNDDEENCRTGHGHLTVSLHAGKAILSALSSTYPLKLLSPYIHDKTALVYLMTYGGGLVGGDKIVVDVKVQSGAILLLLSQGTTKVFKARFGRRLASFDPNISAERSTVSTTTQNLCFHVAADSILLLLPEPVTCFRSALYNQSQKFYLEESASTIILDWITSGRMSMGEEWAFSRYYSVNEIFLQGKRMAKDVMLLDDIELGKGIPSRPLSERLKPYSCYAMLFLHGPRLLPIIATIIESYNQISVFKTKVPAGLIWSLSPIDSTKQGVVIRVAGVQTETVKEWLKEALADLEPIIGSDAYRRVFP